MRRVALLAALLAAAALPADAAAHARLLGSTPAAGAVLADAPAEVRVRFDDRVSLGPGIAAVDARGRSVLAPRKPPQARGRVLVVPLTGLRDGGYSVRWSVISDDGHRLAGVLSFSVGAAAAAPALPAGDGLAPIDVSARWLLLAGALLAAGVVAFRLAVARRHEPLLPLLAAAGFVLVAFGAGLEVPRVPAGTRFGTAMVAELAAAGAGLLLAALPRALPLAAAPALAVLVAQSLAGHALDPGVTRLAVAADVVHLATAAVWVGGLAALAILQGRGARRFSVTALASVLVLAATGVLRALPELRGPGDLVTTGYGRALLVKSGLLLALVGLGALARRRVRRGERPGGIVPAELALAAGAVVAVAFLTALPPGRSLRAGDSLARGPAPLPPRDALVLASHTGRLAVALAARPGELTATILGPDGDGAAGRDVEIAGHEAAPCGPGCYRVEMRPVAAVEVAVEGERPVRFLLPAAGPTPAAAALLHRVERAYRNARGAVYSERLASGPGTRLDSTWRVAAPDRVAYTTAAGDAGVVVGGRRWDRSGRGPWRPSPQSPPLRQPVPPWSAATNVSLLSPGRLSFLDRTIPAWFAVSFDPRTLRLRRVEMTAAAHFMTDAYSSVGPAPRIAPPG